MSKPFRSKVPLDYSALCDDCRVIFDMREGDCPCCTTTAWLALGQYLDHAADRTVTARSRR